MSALTLLSTGKGEDVFITADLPRDRDDNETSNEVALEGSRKEAASVVRKAWIAIATCIAGIYSPDELLPETKFHRRCSTRKGHLNAKHIAPESRGPVQADRGLPLSRY